MQLFELKHRYLLYAIIFFLAFFVHLIGLNQIGRTWDEQFKVDMGYIAWDRLKAGDLSVQSWNLGQEHPMVAKYIYGSFVGFGMIRLDNGIGSQRELSPWDQITLQTSNYILTFLNDKAFAVMYDFTFPRVVSAMFNSIAVVLTVVIGIRLLGRKWGILPALLLLCTPRFVVMGQLITYESLSVFLFCGTFLAFDRLLRYPQRFTYYIVTGILCGLLFWTRYNNVYIFVFLTGWFALHYSFHKDKKIFSPNLLLIPVIVFLIGFLTWPLLWQEFPLHLIDTFKQHESRGIGPSLYFIKYLIVTTPIVILVGLLLGIGRAVKKIAYWQAIFLWWFFSTIMFFTIFSFGGGGTRYIFTIYPALAILTGYGFSFILRKKFVYLLIPIFLFLLWEMVSVFPYYLDYYNQFVGGPKGAAQKGFDFSWWGEGQREVGLWLNEHARQNASVGLIVTPKYVYPKLRGDLKPKGYVTPDSDADYLVVSRFDIHNLPKKFFSTHQAIYAATVDSEALVTVYKRKSDNTSTQ